MDIQKELLDCYKTLNEINSQIISNIPNKYALEMQLQLLQLQKKDILNKIDSLEKNIESPDEKKLKTKTAFNMKPTVVEKKD